MDYIALSGGIADQGNGKNVTILYKITTTTNTENLRRVFKIESSRDYIPVLKFQFRFYVLFFVLGKSSYLLLL